MGTIKRFFCFSVWRSILYRNSSIKTTAYHIWKFCDSKKRKYIKLVSLRSRRKWYTRIMFHAVRYECRSLFLFTGDNDVLVVTTYVFSVCPGLSEPLIVETVWKKQIFVSVWCEKYLQIPKSSEVTSINVSCHFFGCDTTSPFAGKGKLFGWNAWL